MTICPLGAKEITTWLDESVAKTERPMRPGWNDSHEGLRPPWGGGAVARRAPLFSYIGKDN